MNENTLQAAAAAPVPEGLWTVKEVAAYLGVSESWVYQARRRGVLPAIKLGSRVRFHPDAIRAWARGQGAWAQSPLDTRTIELPTCRGTRPGRG